MKFLVIFGGAKRDRTADLLHAMQALSQLSYGPITDHALKHADLSVGSGGAKQIMICS